MKARLENVYDYGWKIKNYDRVVVLTEEDKTLNWTNNEKVTVIPNPSTFSSAHLSSLTNKKIITSGRLVYQKNQTSLINAFSKVMKHHSDWTLEIYGEGGLKRALQKEIEAKGLSDNVKLMGAPQSPGIVFGFINLCFVFKVRGILSGVDRSNGMRSSGCKL